MNNELEIVKHLSFKHVNIFVNDIIYRNIHFHNEIEILYVLNGNGHIRIENEVYEAAKDDIYIINFNKNHEISASSNQLRCLIIQISHNFINEYCPYFKEILFNTPKIVNNGELIKNHIISCSYTYFKQENLFEMKLLNSLLSLIMSILENVPYAISAYSQNDKIKISRMKRWQDYIDDHLETVISLNDLAKKEDLSITHLSHLFKDYFGVTFQEYANNLRFEKALSIIKNKSLSIFDIALYCGFSDPKYLNKQFKKHYGISAKEYRDSSETKVKDSSHKSLNEYKYNTKESLDILKEIINFNK